MEEYVMTGLYIALRVVAAVCFVYSFLSLSAALHKDPAVRDRKRRENFGAMSVRELGPRAAIWCRSMYMWYFLLMALDKPSHALSYVLCIFLCCYWTSYAEERGETPADDPPADDPPAEEMEENEETRRVV